MISLLSTPASGKFGWYHDMARGVVYLSYVVAIETENQFQVATLQVVNQIIDSQSGLTPNPQRIRRAGLADAADDSNLARAGADVLRTWDEGLRPREAPRAAANGRTAELNRRIGDVLAIVSGREPTADARKWWKWWSAESDTALAGEKPTFVV